MKQKKLFDANQSNNLSQQNLVNIVNTTIFPDRNYLISKIQEVLRYSSEIHKITKLENHEGKEITPEELVDQYYKDPDKYFEVNRNNAAAGEIETMTAVSTTSIEPEIRNNEIQRVSDEYSLDT